MAGIRTAGAWLIARIYRAYFATLRIEVITADGRRTPLAEYAFEPHIFACCERDALALGGVCARDRFLVLVAPGRDGDWAAVAFEALGCRVVRGSTLRRGVSAARTILRRMRQAGGPTGIVVDGPLGPAGQPKAGVLFWGSHTGRPVRAGASAARWQVVFGRSWSRMYLPLPGSRVTIALHDPLWIPPAPADGDRDRLLAELTARLAWARTTALHSMRRRPQPTGGDGHRPMATIDR